MRITISLVTYNSADHLRSCVGSLFAQKNVIIDIILIDNGSSDETLISARILQKEAEQRGILFEVIRAPSNAGYGAGHNIAIRRSDAPYIFFMNPDALLSDGGTLSTLVQALEEDLEASSAGPRIYLKERKGYLDSTGLQFSRDRRVIDRDKEEKDVGQNNVLETVFGLTGAAVLYRREALEDAVEPARNGGTEYFDEDYFMYKEDVELAWRLNNLGWHQLFVPSAHVLHGRSTRGRSEGQGVRIGEEFRKKIDPAMLRYSFRNHRLLMIKNERWQHFLRDVPWMAWREVLFFGFLLLRERSTLPAYWGIIKLAPRAFRLRRYHASRWRVGWRSIADLFVTSRFFFWKK